MGEDQAAPASAPASIRAWRPAPDRGSALPGGYSLDAAHRLALGSITTGVGQRLDLLATAAGLGGQRGAFGPVAGVPGRTRRGGQTRLGAGVLGRQLCPRQKGGAAVGKTKKGKGTKWMALVDGQGIPLGVELAGANRAEVKLVDAVLYKARLGREKRHPKRLIADRAYDCEPLRRQLRRRGIEPLIPARRNNTRATGQDGRRLRRYRHRWKVERTFAWLGHCRRLVVRYEHNIGLYRGFFHLACALLTLKWVLK